MKEQAELSQQCNHLVIIFFTLVFPLMHSSPKA